MQTSETVILIHGLWMSGLEMSLLRRRIELRGYHCHLFRYASLRQTPEQNAFDLNVYLQRLRVSSLHFVAHSLGGIVLLHLFQHFPRQPPGRIVLLGTPVTGSSVARNLAQSPGLRHVLGRSIHQGLLGDAPEWSNSRELGVIAGNLDLGLGQFFGSLSRPHDGTVAVAETRLPGATAHLQVHASHTGLLLSRTVAQAACNFLRTGSFD